MNMNSIDIIKSKGYSQYDEIWEIPKKADTQYLSHSYYRYIGKFPPQIPRELIKDYTEPGYKILDPMCGGGTTLIEAKLAGCDVVGCDVNPVSLLVSSVVSRKIDPEKIKSKFLELQKITLLLDSDTLFHDNQNVKKIDLVGNDKYFTDEAIEKISFLSNWISTIKEKEVADFFELALLAILRQVSKANVKKMNVTIDENKKIKDVIQTYLKQVIKMIDINMNLQNYYSNDTVVDIYNLDARKLPFDDSTFDMVIIHPPYLSNTAFSESTQLQLAVMGVNHKKIWKEELKARGSYASVTDGLRKYLVGWNSILKEAYRVLKIGGICAIENGDGQIDYVRIPVGEITKEFAKDIGFSIEKHILHKINNNTGLTLTRKMKDHHIIIMRKEENF